MRLTKAEKARRLQVQSAYYRHFSNVPVMMLDIPKIYKAIENAIDQGTITYPDFMPSLVAQYRADKSA